MINWLRPTTNLFICVYSSNDDGLSLKYFSDLEMKARDIKGESIRLDIERHIDGVAEHIVSDSEEFMLYCNLLIGDEYEYQISAGDVRSMEDKKIFEKNVESIIKRIDECFSQSIPFTFSFDYMDFDYDDAPYRYIYEYIIV